MNSTLVSQLVPQVPMFVAYAVAVVLAIIFWQRCPTSCLLTLIAVGLFIATSIGHTLLFSYLVHARDGAVGDASLGTVLTVVGFAGGVLRAIAFGLMLWAIFAGRKAVETPWTDE